ncbi:Cro/Cl family transcriptional regulator [Vibrio parahaemolyticus]|uniref:helicase RepA family protein n=1 Tax=Vibrio parahaemolyticus TaxID=670 RepID=UPI00111D72C8|nr:helicase RepA family protein [Vibrio parahaemolyticus]TOC00421.1 Cro/Cl family transcriptional regulator [Vibrio parahaemolyticus]WJE04182.1 helicase RepA family protein [Vibrio parahaemolyticus]HCE2309534.1 AAA family ATPase [Vibrio parahaemolyticus]HCE4678248.1 AAA family ATPase [Vibrio parahaemolyticus]
MVNPIKKTFEKIKEFFGNLAFTRGSEGFANIQEWLVKGMFSKRSFGVIYGKSGSRKSFITIDMSCAIASGSTWQNRRTQAGAVVYIAAEGQAGMAKRVKAWEIANKRKVKHLYILGNSMMMTTPSDRNELINSIREIEGKNKVKVQLIVLDTLARNFDGDENSSDAMGKFIHACDLVKDTINASILCVHHSGKDTSRGGRGSSALNAASDFEFQVTHDSKTGLTTLSNTKQKDAEEAPNLVFEFQPVDLGVKCEDGEPITSLALLTPATTKSSETGDNNPLLKALREVFGGSCTREDLRKHCFPPREGVATNTTNQNFKRTLAVLVDNGLVSVEQKGKIAHGNDTITARGQLELF